MVCEEFIHIGLGDTGEHIIRRTLAKLDCICFINTAAHLPLKQARKFSGAPSFSFVRNPFDWYISFWIHELKTRRWRGSFRDWLLGRESRGICMWEHWQYITAPGVDYVGKFETLEDDYALILPRLIPGIVTEAEVHSWFPAAYKIWGGRPWMEGIEQYMRMEVFTPELVELVYEQDHEIFAKWGYGYEDRYIF